MSGTLGTLLGVYCPNRKGDKAHAEGHFHREDLGQPNLGEKKKSRYMENLDSLTSKGYIHIVAIEVCVSSDITSLNTSFTSYIRSCFQAQH
jgi:hypothetical protein